MSDDAVAPAVALTEPQRLRLARFGANASADIHCHCLPGLDDGPRSPDDALALCRALVDDGITTCIATPHQLGAYAGRNEAATVRSAVASLNRSLVANQIP